MLGLWRKLTGRGRQLNLEWESDAALGLATAAIAVCFIAGIVAAFIYAADTDPVLNAQNKASITETTGSGGAGR
jgi:hypothetical protein